MVFDDRFKNASSVTKNCWQNYVQYHNCIKSRGENDGACIYFKEVYTKLCPVALVSVTAHMSVSTVHVLHSG